jgi:hypothetical protein
MGEGAPSIAGSRGRIRRGRRSSPTRSPTGTAPPSRRHALRLLIRPTRPNRSNRLPWCPYRLSLNWPLSKWSSSSSSAARWLLPCSPTPSSIRRHSLAARRRRPQPDCRRDYLASSAPAPARRPARGSWQEECVSCPGNARPRREFIAPARSFPLVVIPGHCAAVNPEPMNTASAGHVVIVGPSIHRSVFLGSGSRPLGDLGMTSV